MIKYSLHSLRLVIVIYPFHEQFDFLSLIYSESYFCLVSDQSGSVMVAKLPMNLALYCVPCWEMKASWMHFAVWELHGVPALSLGRKRFNKKTKTKKAAEKMKLNISVSSLLNLHFCSFTISPEESSLWSVAPRAQSCSARFEPKQMMSSDTFLAPDVPAMTSWIVCCNTSASEFRPKRSLLKQYTPVWFENIVMYLDIGSSCSWWYPEQRLILLKNTVAPLRSETSSSVVGMACYVWQITLFALHMSIQSLISGGFVVFGSVTMHDTHSVGPVSICMMSSLSNLWSSFSTTVLPSYWRYRFVNMQFDIMIFQLSRSFTKTRVFAKVWVVFFGTSRDGADICSTCKMWRVKTGSQEESNSAETGR